VGNSIVTSNHNKGIGETPNITSSITSHQGWQPTTSTQPLPPQLTEDYILEVYPEQQLDTRKTTQGDLEVLIKWKHLPDIENSWESAVCIHKEFQEFHLEDKVNLNGGVLIGLINLQKKEKRRKLVQL